jgi:hypothetical protein
MSIKNGQYMFLVGRQSVVWEKALEKAPEKERPKDKKQTAISPSKQRTCDKYLRSCKV